MAINKNFVIKNGVEVNTSLIVGDATLNKVGVGTTVPGYTLHVGGSRGGIGATDLTVTGIATVGTSGSTAAALSVVGVSTFQGDIILLGSAGVSTISFDASLDKLNFADNARATFGTGNDLQIYHDGSNSYIQEAGTGSLIIYGTGETLAAFTDDGSVQLYNNDSKKLETTGLGITVYGDAIVSGVVTAASLNVTGVSTFTSVGSDLIPNADGTRNIGAATSEWGDLFIDGTANIDALVADTAIVSDLTENRVVIAGTDGELEDDSNFTFDGAMLKVGTAATVAVNGNAAFAGIVTVGGNLRVAGDLLIQEDVVLDTNLTILGIATISNLDNTGAGIGSLSVSGVSTFSGDLIVGVSTLFADVSTGRIGIGTAVPASTLDVDGALTVNSAKVEDLTDNRVVIAGTDGELEDSGNLTFDGSTLAVTGAQTVSSSITVSTGATISANGNAGFAGIVTAKGVIDANGGINASSAKVEDLTDNRVVIAGSGGELEDDGNFTFDGAMLKVGTAATIAVNGNAAFAGIVTVGGDLNVIGDIVYDEITGRNLNITGISTQAGQVNFGTSGVGATIFANGNITISGFGTVANRLNVGSSTLNDRAVNAINVSTTVGAISANNHNANGILFQGYNASVDANNASFVVTSDGSTGIATAVPRQALDVDGVSLFHGDVQFAGSTGTASTVLYDKSDNSLKFVDSAKAKFGSGGDLEIFHNGTDSRIDNNTGDLYVETTGSGDDILIQSADDIFLNPQGGENGINIIGNGAVELYFDNSKKLETTATGIIATGIATAGAGRFTSNLTPTSGQGLEIFCPDTSSAQIQAYDRANTEWDKLIIKGNPVEIYDGSAKKFETTGAGVTVTGICSASGGFDIGIHSAGISVATGPIKILNFVGTGNTFAYSAATDTIDISIAGGGGSGGSESDTSVSSTSATSIYTTAHATNRSVSAIIQITQGTSYQVGRYLVIHDGTTATIIEESAIATGDMLGTFTADINGSNLRILVNMVSASSATVTILPTVVTV